MPAAGVVTIVAVVLIVLALVYYLVNTIVQLQKIAGGLDTVIASVGEILEKTAPLEPVVGDINDNLDAAVSALEGRLVKQAGMTDAVGRVDGRYPGAAAQGFRDFPESREVTPPRIGEVYTRGTLTLARLGREAPIAMGNPAGPALRDPAYGSAAAHTLYAEVRPTRSPVIGTDAPVQYEQREDIGRPRKRFRRA